jgi:hypothetical protein
MSSSFLFVETDLQQQQLLSQQPQHDLQLFHKCVAGCLIFVIGLLSAAAPLRLVDINEHLFSVGNMFSAGVLLSAGLVQ